VREVGSGHQKSDIKNQTSDILLKNKDDQFRTSASDCVALAPQLVAEFVHVVTDDLRFQQPFSIDTALNKSEHCWNAAETDRIFPNDAAVAGFYDSMRRHQLGRKRVLDTSLVTTYRAAGVTSLLTLNKGDFAIFGEFSFVPLAAAPK
jgi:hypothetical protein